MHELFENFHFLRPWWFLLLLPLAIGLWLLVKRKFAERGWERICDAELIPHVLIRHPDAGQRSFVSLLAIAGLLAILALAGPAWERLPQPVYRADTALVIALDLSRSMEATDIAPNRLDRARFKVIDILEQRGDGETALVVYAGDAFTVTPLTTDTDTIRSQLPALSTALMPIQGHRADLALELAASLMRQAGHVRGNIILITDEIDSDRDVARATRLNGEGYRISVLGVGTRQGAPVNLPNGGFLKNAAGEIVIPMLDPGALSRLAAAGGGHYRNLSIDDSDVRALLGMIETEGIGQSGSETGFTADVWREQGPWLVLLLIPIAALSFRRGVILVLACLLAPLPQPVQAMDWDALWLNDNQRAHKLLQRGDSAAAAGLFSEPDWQAAARYRAGEYEKSLEILDEADDITSTYNKGNALARLRNYKEAIAAYEQVLEQDPEHEDARHNLDLVREAREKQKAPPQQSPSGGDQKKQDSDDDEGEPQDNSQSPAGEQEDAAQPRPDAGNQEDGAQDGDDTVSGTAPGQDQGEEDRRPQSGRPGEESNEMAEQSDDSMPGREATDEETLETEQLLRRIPDDPGGLLREKFRLQYKQRGLSRHNYEQDW